MAARTKVYVDIVTKADGKEPGSGLKKFAIGAGIATVAIAGLIKIGKDLVNVYAVQEQAEARLEATIKSTGQAAGLTADQLKDMATGLQGVTKFGDEAIIGAESLLLTFKDIGGDVFPRALESILDVSEAMGTGLKESSIQVGKALNDPIQGLTALRRVGIQFSDAQEDLIKGFVETGDKASAQTIILEELESQFGGVAKAAADTASGSMTQFSNVLGDLQEELGQTIAEGLQPFVKESTNVVTALVAMIKEGREVNKVLEEMREGGENSGASLEELENSLARLNAERAAGAALGVNADLKEEIALVESLIENYDRLQIELQETADRRKRISEANSGYADLAKLQSDLEASAEERLAELQNAKLTDKEKAIALLSTEIDHWANFRDIVGVQEILNELVAERNGLMVEEVPLIEGVMTAEDVLEQKRADDYEILLGREENRKRLREEEKEQIQSLLEAMETFSESSITAGEDWLSMEQEKVEHLIWIDDLETEIHERRIKETDAELKAYETMIRAKVALAKQFANLSLSFLSALDSLQSNNANAELMRMEEAGASQEELDKKKREIAHDEAIRKRDFGLFSVAIETAIAIAEAVPNPILMALAAALGGLQAAAISAAPIPSLATGGSYITDGPEINNGNLIGDNASGLERHTIEPLGGSDRGGSSRERFKLVGPGNELLGFIQRVGIDNRGLHSSRGGKI